MADQPVHHPITNTLILLRGYERIHQRDKLVPAVFREPVLLMPNGDIVQSKYPNNLVEIICFAQRALPFYAVTRFFDQADAGQLVIAGFALDHRHALHDPQAEEILCTMWARYDGDDR